jgi:hypothetical protein
VEREKADRQEVEARQPWIQKKKTERADKLATKKQNAMDDREARKMVRAAARADVITM